MPDIIHLLSDDLANKIAAGEVVVRPAAVVKELLENSVDAGATEIQLIVKDGGKALIQVVDNGNGMSPTDARMSFERHATSKIKQIDDLFSINTMGFRGEALPSIAAVSKVELKSKKEDDSIGTRIAIEGAQLITQEACQCKTGTNISVKSLFFNVPARRKFLKSTPVETKHIIEEFIRISLANSEIKMLLFNNEKEVYHLPGQPLHKRIAAIFGKKMEERIVQVHEETEIVNVSGFIGKPEFAKKSKGEQYFFVNNRFIRSPYLNHAILKAYSDFIDPKHYPLYVLFLEIDPQNIDINVHPSKHEVKFEDEKHVYTIVSAAARHALSKFLVTPTLDFEIDPTFNRHEFFKTPNIGDAKIENESSKHKATFLNRGVQGQGVDQKDWQQLYTFPAEQEERIASIGKQERKKIEAETLPITQIQNRYLAVPDEKGFLLIDQRRAHQRVLYEQFLNALKEQGFPSQKMMFPETVTIPANLVAVFTEHANRLNHLGFEVEHFGGESLVVHATPSEIPIPDLNSFLETLLSELGSGTSTNQSQPEKAIAKHLAMYGAIKHGLALTSEEQKALVTQLMNCDQPNYGIRRDKTFIKYSFDELDKAFQL